MAARRQVTRSVTVPATPQQVWRVVGEPAGLAGWLGPGAASRVLHVDTPGEAQLEIWWCAQPGGQPAPEDVSVVQIGVEAAEGGSRVTVTETALVDHPGPPPPGLDLHGGCAVGTPEPAVAGAPRA